jgi:hypothetical protein
VSLAVEVSPSLLHLPPDVVSSSGVEAIEFAKACGIELDPWQAWFVNHALAERVDKSGELTWAAFEVGLVTPRQNGKNFILETIQLAAMYLFGDMTLVHSAHKFDTSVEHFNRLRWLFENTPELSALLLPGDRSFVTSNGKEHIRLNTGQRILFKARYRGGARGFTGDKVFMDEAYDLAPAAMGAIIPTLSTRPGAQVYYTSSAPHESSRVLHAVRARAVKGSERDRLFFAEFGNDDTVLELSVDDPAFMAAIRAANPAVAAGRISEDYIVQEILTFSGDADLVDEHRRERLGVPTMPIDDSSGRVIPLDLWDSLVAEKSDIVSGETFALDVSPDRAWASLAVAGRCADGLLQVEVIERKPDTDWVLADLIERKAAIKSIRIEKNGPARSFIALLREAGFEVEEVSTADHAGATGQFIDAAKAHQLRHLGSVSLRAAVAAAVLRHTGDADLWGRRSSKADITPLVACTIALGGVPDTTDAPEGRFYSMADLLNDE